jgi:hypothetical protein
MLPQPLGGGVQERTTVYQPHRTADHQPVAVLHRSKHRDTPSVMLREDPSVPPGRHAAFELDTDLLEDHFGQACIRCPSRRLDLAARPRLAAIIENLNDRVQEARMNGWPGEVQGLQSSLDKAIQKLVQLDRARERQPSAR